MESFLPLGPRSNCSGRDSPLCQVQMALCIKVCAHVVVKHTHSAKLGARKSEAWCYTEVRARHTFLMSVSINIFRKVLIAFLSACHSGLTFSNHQTSIKLICLFVIMLIMVLGAEISPPFDVCMCV